MLTFKIADKEWEYSEIHKLNYETFVEEIPQHQINPNKYLVDKFHEQNNYIICIKDDYVAGMIVIRDKRPFSLDGKLQNLEKYLPESGSICEIRLLSIKKEDRKRKVIQGLFNYLAEYCEEKKYDLALISATTNQERLYKTLGFQPFGPLVGTNGAKYQPMFLTPSSYYDFKNKTKLLNGLDKSPENLKKYLFQPGPVGIKREVENEFKKPPISHRSEEFNALFKKTQEGLCRITNSKYTQIFTGSGTLSNDLVAAQISKLKSKGLILTNGEFGDRLVNHATRFNLDFDTVKAGWGRAFDYSSITDKTGFNSYDWIWFVHCETSTGILNDLDLLKEICAENKIKLCADCISSIGNIKFDLGGLYLGTGSSGKGLASYPGLCFVFHNSQITPNPDLPRYLDLGLYSLEEGVPFTLSSNLLSALNKSLELINVDMNRENADSCSLIIRNGLEEMGIGIINDKRNSSPSVVTFKIDENLNSVAIGEELEELNIYLSYRSSYLTERNLMQFALMGEYSKSGINFSLKQLQKLI
ncbi:MAG: GNAT family N-acetyltransferase [Thermodesulfobacteriota bacterium]